MDQVTFRSEEELLAQLDTFGSIHVECGQEQGDRLFDCLRRIAPEGGAGYVLRSDAGYNWQTVNAYLRFWARLHGNEKGFRGLTERFGLQEVSAKRLSALPVGERMRVQLARVSLQSAEAYFLEEPLLNQDSENTGRVLEWMAERSREGTHFITVNASLRQTLLMPGTAFYAEDGAFCMVEENGGAEEDAEAGDIRILKIPARSGSSTLLFEPGDIDFVESLNKSNYLSVRGTLFQVSQTMEELEGTLARCGFFRCHRSYIVNMQRVGQIERLSKNSFCLLLEDKERTRIPLSKGRVEEMKETFGWQGSF